MKFLIFAFLLSIAIGGRPVFAQGFRIEGGQPPSIHDGGTFVSLEGKFSIALPAHQRGFAEVALDTPVGRASGDAYTWVMKEGSFTAVYVAAAKPLDDPTNRAATFANLRKSVTGWTNSKEGKVVIDREFTFDSHPALELKSEFPAVAFWQRFYLVSGRLYQIVVTVRTDQRSTEADAVKVLDTFKLLSDAEVAAALKVQTAATEPSPLPQEPVVPRAGSDAADDRLHGRVKTLFRESEDLSGTWSVQGRKPSAMKYYNESGNLTKEQLYDYKGNLSEVTVFGYIDGARVASSKTVEHNYNPPPMAAPPGTESARPKADPRYSNKFTFLYDEQKRVTEKKWFLSNSELTIRYVYKYRGNPVNEVEELVYSSDGSLNQRYVYLLDEKGNEIEKTSFNPRDGSVQTRSKYVYEFDAQGNWTRRTTSQAKGDRADFVPAYVDYRTITYY